MFNEKVLKKAFELKENKKSSNKSKRNFTDQFVSAFSLFSTSSRLFM